MCCGFGTTILASSPNLYCSRPEYLLLRVAAANCRPFLIVIVYRPPKIGYLAVFWADFENLLPSFSMALIVGDFNIDLNCTSYDVDALHDRCASNNLFIVPYSNTHYSASSHTRVDHCLISDSSLLKSFSQTPLPFLSMHDLIEVTLDFLVHRLPPRLITIRDYSRFNLDFFRNSLASLNWSVFNQLIMLDEKVATLTCYLLETIGHMLLLRHSR